jgi:hypothetical protein
MKSASLTLAAGSLPAVKLEDSAVADVRRQRCPDAKINADVLPLAENILVYIFPMNLLVSVPYEMTLFYVHAIHSESLSATHGERGLDKGEVRDMQ